MTAASAQPVDPPSSSTSGITWGTRPSGDWSAARDRKSTRLNSSHGYISYAVFCLKKKNLSRLVSRAGERLPDGNRTVHGARLVRLPQDVQDLHNVRVDLEIARTFHGPCIGRHHSQ